MGGGSDNLIASFRFYRKGLSRYPSGRDFALNASYRLLGVPARVGYFQCRFEFLRALVSGRDVHWTAASRIFPCLALCEASAVSEVEITIGSTKLTHLPPVGVTMNQHKLTAHGIIVLLPTHGSYRCPAARHIGLPARTIVGPFFPAG